MGDWLIGRSTSQLYAESSPLFNTTAKVRLVTTNFDLHFSTAALSVYEDESPETYSAPALPIGNDFTGPVYLHGSVDKPARRLILTDSDFGRAYLTEGWAPFLLSPVIAFSGLTRAARFQVLPDSCHQTTPRRWI
ncbi:MAG: SIR2 family protein [Terriglobales bacterium]